MAGKPDQYPWEKIRAEFIAGKKPRELSKKYGPSPNLISKRASLDGWVKLRKETSKKIAAELPAVIAEKVISAASEIVDRHFEIWDKMLEKAEGMLSGVTYVPENPLDPNSKMVPVAAVAKPKDLQAWASAVKAASEGQRTARNLDKLSTPRPDDPDFDGSLWDGADDDQGDETALEG